MNLDSEDELRHWGILGMRWGQRKSQGTPGVARSTDHMAKKDAKRFVDAKMFYGETAGTRRKLLRAELDKKIKTIPGYQKAFDAHIANVDRAKSAQKAVRERTKIDTVKKGRSFIKKALNITGPLSVAAASAIYLANKPKVDHWVMSQAQKILAGLK